MIIFKLHVLKSALTIEVNVIVEWTDDNFAWLVEEHGQRGAVKPSKVIFKNIKGRLSQKVLGHEYIFYGLSMELH